jgi:hypothetical protein
MGPNLTALIDFLDQDEEDRVESTGGSWDVSAGGRGRDNEHTERSKGSSKKSKKVGYWFVDYVSSLDIQIDQCTRRFIIWYWYGTPMPS